MSAHILRAYGTCLVFLVLVKFVVQNSQTTWSVSSCCVVCEEVTSQSSMLCWSFDVICFNFRRKTETESYPSRSKPWMPTTASPYAIQGPYAFSDVTKLPHTALDSRILADIMTKYSCAPSQGSQCDDYENVSCMDRESGFVTNDIYETCRAQSRQAGWVENEIYG